MCVDMKQSISKPIVIKSPSHVHKHFDSKLNKMIVTLSPGGLYITNNDELISTVLGSCISVCVRDTVNGIAAMNHFMVPDMSHENSQESNEELFRYGRYSMDYMLKQLYSLGAVTNMLEVKVFGGGAIISSVGDVGNDNINFINRYLINHQLISTNQDMGGELPRKVKFFVKTGKVYVKHMRALHKCVVAARENKIK